MKQSKRLSIFTTFLMSVGLLTFIPSTSPAQAAAAVCSGATCSQSFSYTGAAQQFTPSNVGVPLTITLNGAAGGKGGNDAGTTGGAAYLGSRVVFTYTPTTTNSLYLYIGSAGNNGGSAVACGGGAGGGFNPWTAYNGGNGGNAGCSGTSGAGAGGGSATVIATGDKTGVIGVAGGGGGGGGASLWGNGTAGSADTGTQNGGTAGSAGAAWSGDGAGGGGGGAGYTGGTGGAGADDTWSPGGKGGVTGKSFPSASPAVVTSNANAGGGSITITWPNGPSQVTAPSFTNTTTAKVGQVLVPADGTFTPSVGTVTISNRRWQISTDGVTWTDISPKVSENYTIAAGDVNKYVRFAEDVTDSVNTLTYGSSSSLQITAAPVFTAENPVDAAANTSVNTVFAGYTFVATGYRNVYTISSGALPAGITLNTSTGALSGTATAPGSFKYKVKVTNDAGTDETAELTLIVGKVPVFTSDDSVLQSVNRVTNPIRVGSTLPNFVFTTSAFPAATYELKTDSATIPTCTVFATTCASNFETLGLPEGLAFNPTTATLSGTPTKTGAFVFAIKATNANGSAVDYIHMSIAAKAPVAFNLSSDKNAVTIVQNTTVTATVTASGGSGNGAYSFSVDAASTSICSVAQATANTATMTVIAAGNCVINGLKAADAGFAASRASITIPVNKAPQTAALTVTTDLATFIYGAASSWVRGSGGNGSGGFTWAIDPSTASNCSVGQLSGNAMYLSNPSAGNCWLVVTKAGDAFFQPQTTKFLIPVEKAQITGLYIGQPSTVNWNGTNPPSVTLNTGGGQGTGAVSYNLDPTSADTCSLNGNVLTAKSAGTCMVTATKAGDSNYKPMTSPAITWTINQINQPAISTTGATTAGTNIAYNSQVPYAANPDVLAVLTTTGGAGTGSYAYSAAGASNCVVAGAGATAYVTASPSGSGIGWCTITITKNADSNYNSQSTTFQFNIVAGPQTALVATPANSSLNFIPSTLTLPATGAKTRLTVTGGLGTGAISYAVASGSSTVCSVDEDGMILSKTAGTCVVNVTKAADSNYQVQTTSATVVFNKLAQEELVAVPANASEPFVWSPKATNQISLTGGTGTGAISYTVSASSVGVCSVNSAGLITSITAGNCVVNVTKAADTNYNVATDQVQVVFTKIDPAAISLSSSPALIVYTTAANKNKAWVTVTGGASSSGAFTFYVDPMTEEYCSITAIQATQVQIAGNQAGLCLIIVVQAADVNYNEQRAYLGVNITKMAQTISATSSASNSVPFKVAPDVATTINVTGQAGTGITRYVVDPANNTSNCSVDQATGNVTSTTIGSCRITVSRDGDSNVADSNSVVLNLTINKINQSTITATPSSDFRLAAVGSPAATSVLSFGAAYTGTGNFTKIASSTPLVCTITGGGDSTLATPTFTATNDLTGKITVTAVNDGTCTLTYTKLGDNNFNVATNATVSFVINKATQAEITASITVGSATMPYVATPKATATISGTGGSGTGVFNYTVDSTSSTVCSVNPTTGVVTNVTAGTCIINVKKLTDNDYAESPVKTVTITFTKIDQAAFTLTAAKSALKATTSALDTTTVSVAGGSSTGAVTYSVAADSLTVCSISGTTVTGIGAGECTIVATKAADVNYNVATATVKLTVTKGTQNALAVSPYWPTIGFVPQTAADSSLVNAFVWSGGTGPGELVFTIDPSSAQVCNRAGMRPGVPSHIQVFALGSGTCTISVYKSGGTAWENSNTVISSFTITKIAQAAITASASKSTIAYSDAPAATFTVAVTGGSGDGVTSVSINPASATVCSDATVAGGVITVKAIGVGNCLLSGVKASSAGYTQVTSAQITVVITKGSQAPIVVSANPSAITYTISPKTTSAITVTGGSGNGALTISVDSGSTAVCRYDNVAKTVVAIAPGLCDLTATKAAGADGLFNAQTGKLRIVIAKTAQAKLNLSATFPQLLYSEASTPTTPLSISGGSGTGAVTYAVSPGAASVCSFSFVNGVPTITATYYGFCEVTATKAGDSIYGAATATATIRIALAGTQIAATVPSTTVGFVAAPGTVSTVTVVGSLPNDVLSYSVDNASKNICSVAGNGTTATVTALGVGLCSILVINVSKASDGTLIASSAATNLNIVKGDQTGVTVTPASPSVYFATPAATNVITVTGGIAGTIITATVDPLSAANCSVTVSANKVTMTALKVGECIINVTKAGNAVFNDYTSTLTIPILKTKQAAFTASASPSALTYAANSTITSTITATGGSGTGEVSYELTEASASICSLAGNVVTVITGGDCTVLVTKAGDVNYSDATATVTIKIAKGTQSVLTVTAVEQSLTFSKDIPVSTEINVSGGSGDGEIRYAVAAASSAICSIEDGVVTALRPGTCTITATKAADPFFNAATATVTITINKSAQDALVSRIASGELSVPLWNAKNTTQVIITGGDGYGALSLTGLTPTICSVALVGQRVNVTALTEGTCQFRVTKESDYAFLASEPLVTSIEVDSAETDLTVTVSTVGKTVAGGRAAIDLDVTNKGPAKAAGATVTYTLPAGVTAVAPLGAGCTLTSSTEVSCITSRILEANGSVRFTIPIALAGSLTGGVFTTGGEANVSSNTPDSNEENNSVSGEDANFIVSKAPQSFNKGTLAGMQTGKEFEDQVIANGFPAVTYTVSVGDLPAGLNLNPETGQITGVPTGVGKYAFTISAYNTIGAISQAFSGTIAPAPFVTVPANGFGPNTLPTGTKVTVGGVNLDLITAAIIGGKTVKIVTKTSASIVLEVPNATAAGEVTVSLVFGQGTLDAGTFTYTGTAKVTPVIVLTAGALSAGAGESARTLSSSITASGVQGEIEIPVTYTSKTTGICRVSGNQLNFVAAGNCTLQASTAASSSFNAASSAEVSIAVTKSSQTLTVVKPENTVPPTKTTDSADGFDLEVSSSSGLAPIFSTTTPTICEVTEDGHVTGLALGRCVVTVSQPGDARFAAAPSSTMELNITADAGGPAIDNGDPLRPTSLAAGGLKKMGDAGFTWDKKLANLSIETYGIWIGKINAISEFTIAGKTYKCSVDFGILKAMASKTPAERKLAMAKKVFKASKPFCNAKTEAAAWSALKKGYVGLDVKVTITRFRMYPTTYKPINAVTKKPITTQIRTVYLTLG